MVKKRQTPARPRDPAGRTRHALGAKRIGSGKTYARAAWRRAERAAAKGTEGGTES